MARKSATHPDKARRAFLRGTAHSSPHAAIEAGARTEEEWAAMLEGQHARFWAANGQKARRAVKKRHPMQVSGAS
ncbi:hypothetical protein GO986_17935 [Deinococcus sp. HMF7620]|uniref:Uncharacterized protein n=1 Tax=Deinococcus arboris TaxID=2682977 RepID=A0A7C9MAZ7_9DEIO|nr:hypothetical protein [Deinococcus arboris]MVN88619.1 hypothetical protein [Deinococcus arboris]